jgi:hypothetical protein
LCYDIVTRGATDEEATRRKEADISSNKNKPQIVKAMKKKIIIGIAAAGLSIFGLTGKVQAAHGHGGGGHGGHGGGHHSGGHHGGGHRGGHHGHFAFYGYPFYTSYLGYYGAYWPYYYRNQLYGHPRYSDGSLNLAVQTALARRGYYRGPIDGIIGQGTRRAIRAFQYDEGLPPSGWIDGRVLAELRLI